MTSQKSLKNNVNKNDFKRSLIGSLPFPLIAFAILFTMVTIPVFQYVTAEEFLMAKEHTEISMFIKEHSTFYYSFDLLPIGMVICGMLTALKSFSFMLSKKQVNVFLSLGVKRKTMVTNRLVSGVITLFAAVLLPLLLIYITNIVSFGYHPYQTSLFLYFTALLFVCGLVGYSLISAMIMVSGNIFEAIASALAVTAIPILTFLTAFSVMNYYLSGYIRGNFDFETFALVLTPWTMALNLQTEITDTLNGDAYDYYDIITPRRILSPIHRDVPLEKFEIPKGYEVDWGFILPIVIWFVVAVALIGVTYYLFNKRKAEHSNSLGKFPVSRAVLGTCAFALITYVFAEWFGYEISLTAIFFITALVALIAYFLIQLILTRKPKIAVKSLKWCFVLVGAFAVCCILVNTGFLGTYNRIPDKADVKSVTIEASELSGYEHWIYPWEGDENFVESTTDESKQAILEAYELLKNEKIDRNEDYITSVTLGIRDNNGKIKYRNFDIYTEETYLKYIQLVYGSDYFDAILKNYLVDDIPENTMTDSSGHLKKFIWAFSDNDMIVNTDGETGEEMDYIDDVDGLCKALYDDMSKMTVEELFKNNKKPVGILVKAHRDEGYYINTPTYANAAYYPINEHGMTYQMGEDKILYDPDIRHGMIDDYIPVYDNMTNTLKFLKDNGYELTTEPLKVKEVLYADKKMSLMEAQNEFARVNKDDYRGWGEYDVYLSDYNAPMFEQSYFGYDANYNMGYFIDTSAPVTEYDMLNMIYKDAGNPLTSVKDTAKAQEIADKTVSQYMTLGDDGRYVYVIYENNVMAWYYLPEANLGVIK